MRFPGVFFPNLGDPRLAGLDKTYSDNFPYQASDSLPLQYEGQRVAKSWGRWAVITSGTLGFWGLGVGTGCLSSTLASLRLLSGSLRPVQVTDFGFIFCWARLSPGRGGGREKRRGERTALSAQSWVPLLCLPWPSCHPLREGPVPGHNGGSDPLWDLPWGRTSRPGIGFSTPHLFSICPTTEHQGQKGLRAEADPWLCVTDGNTEARRKALVA